LIRGRGYASARVMLIADGGAESDVSTELAISGDPENKLRKLAHSQGLDFEEKIHNKSGKEATKHNRELLNETYKTILDGEIQQIGSPILVPLGELSFNYLTGLQGIRKFRGSILPHHKIPERRVIPILGPHPYLYEEPKLEFISRLDFSKVKRNENIEGPIPEIGQCWIAQTPGQVKSYFRRQMDKKPPFVVFDIETFANIPTCISFCFDGLESCCVPILDYHINEDDRVLMLLAVAELLRSEIPKVNQNVKFDWRKLEKWGLTVKNVVGDTMIAANCLYCEFPKNLGFLTSIYTDMPYFKDEGKDYDPSSYDRNKLYIYNAKDSLATHQIYSNQLEELKETGTKSVYDMQLAILPIYKRMEDLGIRVDEQQRKNLIGKYSSLYETYNYKLQLLVGREINPLSSLVCQRLVYEELSYKPIRGTKHTSTGKPSADEESLELLLWMGQSPSYNCRDILRTIIDCRKLHKVIELLVLPLYPDGRFRCEFNLAGTVNGRSSAGETTDYMLYLQDNGVVKMGNLGHSFQTIGKHGFAVDGETYGKDIRSMFVPSSGYIFVESDLSQAEARVDAVLASDFDILNVFDGPIGIHKLTGSWVYDCLPNEIKKSILVNGEDRYYVSKTVRHAGERNMKEDRLMMMIHQPVADCAKILKKFHDNQPNIRGVFHRGIREHIMRERVLIAPNGRRRDFFGRIDEHTINEAISFLPQAIVTDYLKQSLVKTFSECSYARPLVEAHDGFLAEVPIGKEEEYARTFKQNVEVDIDFRTCSLNRDFILRIPCESAIGENWQDMEEIKI
jgi:DNA polymerase I-like protein with 3'-5' exonuclease and polymerase domains